MINKLKKFINKETIVYVIFGVLTTAVNYLVFWLCKSKLGIGTLVANIIAFIVAVIFAFITNKIFVFESRSFELKVLLYEFSTFAAARILSFLFEEGFLALTTHLGFNDYIAKAFISIVVIILNYIASKLFIFKKRAKTPEMEDENVR